MMKDVNHFQLVYNIVLKEVQWPVYIECNINKDLMEKVKMLKIEADEVLLIFIGEEDKSIDLPKLISDLNQEDVTFFGGLFPSIIYGRKMSKTGAVITKLPLAEKPLMIKGLDKKTIDLSAIAHLAQYSRRKCTAMVLVDGLTVNINGFLAGLYNKLADVVSYIGGGAGSLSLEQKPCLFNNEGLYQDAAIVTLLRTECKLGVRHGWNKLAGPVVATKTDGNTIYELNWRNAFEVYKKIVEADSGDIFKENNFFTIAKGYPFGMIKDYAESIVRDPLSVGPNGELFCVGAVPENSVLDILKGKPSSLIKAAGQAAAESNDANGNQIECQLIFDCISRALFLENCFDEELAVINDCLAKEGYNGFPLGALTLGEISSYGDGYLEFFNKTIVTGVLYNAKE
jgi:hypothetical protein